jgi:hypothetical protein
LYGRFQGTVRPTPLTPPANTLALNPYSRPQNPARAGAVPGGAQLLDTVRQSPGGGRDLYASPDGNVYQRKSDGWYRRGTGGNWNYYAPAQGSAQRKQAAPARSAPAAATGPGAQAVNPQARGGRAPDADARAQAQNAAALDRDYYARNLGQNRAQNTRPANTVRPAPARPAPARPARGGGGRR